jgi:putative transposase
MREEFVLRALGKTESFSALCREYSISRKTGYKWVVRYKDKGMSGLVDESRRPDSSPAKMTDELVETIIAFRREHPKWGPRKLRVLLTRLHPTKTPPSDGSIARVLRENDLVKKRRRTRMRSLGPPARPPRLDPVEPNDVWTVDFKGWWRTRDGLRCEPLTVRDAATRFLLDVRILPSITTEDVAPVFVKLFDEHGLPKAIQSDNGPPFASRRGLAGLSQLSAWWVSLGINVVRSRPGCPQDNGGHERMHADMLELQNQSAPTLVDQQRLCDEWRTTFNHIRPHESLGMRTPAEVYRPSPRRRNHFRLGGFPDDCSVVAVKQNCAMFDGHKVHVGAAFNGYPVGFRVLDVEHVEVWFFHIRLGTCRPGVANSFEVDPELASPRLLRSLTGTAVQADTFIALRRTRAARTLIERRTTLATAVIATAAALFDTTALDSQRMASCPSDRAPSALDGAAGAVPARSGAASTTANETVKDVSEDSSDAARGSKTVTPREASCNPDCNLFPPASSAATVAAAERGNRSTPRFTPSDGNKPLRISAPVIPKGWPWVSDASRRSSRKKKWTPPTS